MKATVVIGKPKSEEVNLDHVLRNEGVYRPNYYKDIRIVTLRYSEKKNVVCTIYIEDGAVEPLDKPKWRGEKFVKLNEEMTISFS